MKPALLLSILFIVVSLGCGPEKNTGTAGSKDQVVVAKDATSAADYWPMKVGNAWTYEVVRSMRGGQVGADSSRDTVTFKVVSSKEIDGGQLVEIAALGQDLKRNATLVMEVKPNLISQPELRSSAKSFTYSPAFPLIVFPAKQGTVTKWSGAGPMPFFNSSGDWSAEVSCNGDREVDSMQERFKCTYISTTAALHSGKDTVHYKQDSYFAPGVGLVRMVEESAVERDGRPYGLVTTTTTLRSYTLK